MEIIEFRTDNVLKKYIHNEKHSTESDSTYDGFWLKYATEKKISDAEIICSENVYNVWLYICLWQRFFKNEIFKEQVPTDILK